MTRGEQSFLQHIQTIFDSGTFGELTDRQLLERLAGPDHDTAELCFAALIKRHGPMVFRACLAILRDRHDAEDAFQATFLVLARKAGSLWLRDSLGPWLFEVCCRVASHARSAALRRRIHEREASRTAPSTVEDTTWDDRGALLCEELERLPDRYRAAVVLCDLEGLTQERAAQVLGWPAGTVRSRLARGRDRLRARLTRRGLAPALIPPLPWLTADATPAAVPATLAEITTHAAVRLAANRALTGTLASVGSLTEGVLRVMFWNKFKVVAAAMVAGAVFAGTALFAFWPAGLSAGRANAPQSEALAKPAAAVTAGPTGPVSVGARSLSATEKARLDVARKMRQLMLDVSRIDPSRGFSEVITWQNRCDEVVAELLVKTDADKVRFLEHRVAVLKVTEHFIADLVKAAQSNRMEALAAEFYRLEAEDRLEKARAKLPAGGAAAAEKVSKELEQFLKEDAWPPPNFGFPRAAPRSPKEARP